MNLGSAIKKIRKDRKISQKDLAKKSDISGSSLSQIENGQKRPTDYTLQSIAHALNVTDAYIYLSAINIGDIPTGADEISTSVFSGIKDVMLKILEKKEAPCPHDNHACRVYKFCGTKFCIDRANKLNGHF